MDSCTMLFSILGLVYPTKWTPVIDLRSVIKAPSNSIILSLTIVLTCFVAAAKKPVLYLETFASLVQLQIPRR